MGNEAAREDLLFALFAVQRNYASTEAVESALAQRGEDSGRSLAEVLRERGALTRAQCDELARHVTAHLAQPGAEATVSLNGPGSRTEQAEEALDAPGPSGVGAEDGTAPDPSPIDGGQTVTWDRRRSAIDEAGRFRVLRPHARGGIGQVSVALDVELNREVALKEIQPERADDVDSRARFLLEAAVTGQLEHPGVVPVYALGVGAQGRPFYVMRFVRGESLKEGIAQHHRGALKATPGETALALRRLLGRFLGACNAVAYAHSRGVIHRDLKPSNILLGPYGETLVVDWGLAKVVGRGEKPEAQAEIPEPTIRPGSNTGSSETLPGSAIGTPAYMSPEAAEGRIDFLGPASDVYSLGATLYTILAGRAPFEDGDALSVLRRARRGDFPALRDVAPKVDRPLAAICQKAMALRSTDRYATVHGLVEDVEHWLADEPVKAYREGWGARACRWGRRHRTRVLAGMVSLAAVTLVATVAAISVEVAREREARALRGERAAGRRADEEHQKVREEKRKFQEQSCRLALDRGLALFDEGRAAEGMLWLRRALELAPSDDPRLAHVIRVNLGRWKGEVHPILQQWEHENWVVAVAFDREGRRVLTGSRDGTARLWDAATGEPIGPPLRHEESLESVAFHPDGKRLLTASWDGSARLWDAETGRPLAAPMKHGDRLTRAVFSPDGTLVATASRDKTARLWDARTGAPVSEPLAHDDAVLALAFSADGKTLATASQDKTARLWDVATKRLLGSPLVHPGMVADVAFRPDGRVLATAGLDGAARLWSVGSGSRIAELKHKMRVDKVRFSADGSRLATCSYDGTARLWDPETGAAAGPPLEHGPLVLNLCFSPDGKRLATACRDGSVRLWDAAAGTLIGRPMEHRDTVWALSFRPDGLRLATASWDRTARLWDIETARPAERVLRHPSEVQEAAVSPDGKVLATIDDDGVARLWDVATGRPIGSPMRHDKRAQLVSFSRDGRILATGGYDNTARLWDAATGSPVGRPFFHASKVYQARLSPDGRILATASEDKTAQLWDTLTGKPLGPPIEHAGVVEDLAFSPDGKAIATACWDNTARLWEVTSSRPLGPPLKHKNRVVWVAFSPDGKLLATASFDKTARIWSLPSGTPLNRPLDHLGEVVALAFSPDGKTLATASFDRTARLWEVATGRPIGPPLEHQGLVMRVAFSPDGRTLGTASFDRTARLWDSATGKPLAPPFRHDGRVNAVHFGAEPSALITASADRTVRLWGNPREVPGDVGRITHWIAAMTGLDFETGDAVRRLDPAAWRESRRRLAGEGGPPDS
jgi:WD40 repeat protein/tRNA A-37 threonylcarbamoyl transferase component Bud32